MDFFQNLFRNFKENTSLINKYVHLFVNSKWKIYHGSKIILCFERHYYTVTISKTIYFFLVTVALWVSDKAT